MAAVTVTALRVPVWARKGVMVVRRNCLDATDPDHTYHWATRMLAPFGQRPEEFGLTDPRLERLLDRLNVDALRGER